jgi:hypothetical protein
MTAHNEKSKKAKNKKRKLNMKKRNITFGTILLVLGVFALSPAVKAGEGRPFERGPRIVGLWQVDYTSVACDQPVLPPEFLTYQQFHSDGLEIESPIFSLGQCMGVWTQRADRTVQLYHVGWTPGGVPGHPEIVRFVFTETITVSLDGMSFDGSVDQTFYDAPVGGNVVAQCTATTHATRISVP